MTAQALALAVTLLVAGCTAGPPDGRSDDSDPPAACATTVTVSYSAVDVEGGCLRRVTEDRCADYWSEYADGAQCASAEPPLRETSGRCLLLDCAPNGPAGDPQTVAYPAYGDTDPCTAAIASTDGVPCED